ncbi:MAG: hypothetical protein ACOY5S_12065 [Pseudomonadota bacterium]
MAFAALTVDLNAQLAKFEQDMKRAAGTLDSFGTKAAAASARLNTAFGALGLGVGVAGIAAIAKSGIDAADALNDLSARVGVSVKDLASFKLAAQLADTSLENVGAGIARLSRTIGEAERGNKAAAEALAELGINARDPREAFLQLADAVERIEDPNRRAVLLNGVLGKSYQELLPLLSQGGDELRQAALDATDYAEAMSKLSPEAGKFNDQLDRLALGFDALRAKTLSGPLESLNLYIAAFNEVLDTGTALDKLKFFGFGYISEEIANRVVDAGERVQAYNAEIFKLQQQLLELRRVEAAGSPNIERWEKRIADLEATRAGLVEKVRQSVSDAAKGGADDSDKYGKELQEALRKAFTTSPLDDFLATFKDRRKQIAAEYAALKADLAGGSVGEATGLDVSLQLTLGRAALERGDFEASQAALTRAKSLFGDVAAQEGTASFQKSYFLRELERLETDTVNSAEATADRVRETLQQKLGQLDTEATKLTFDVDDAGIVSQVKGAVEQLKKDLAADPLRIPVVAVPGIPQSADLATAAVQYGARR